MLCDNEKSIFFQACNGRKSNYFCGESSYVSVLVVLLAILCLSALPQALLYSFYCCVLMFRICGNQQNKFIANINKKVGREISDFSCQVYVVGFFSIRDLLIDVFFIFYLFIYLFH